MKCSTLILEAEKLDKAVNANRGKLIKTYE